MDVRAALQVERERVAQVARDGADFFEERRGDPLRLFEQGEEKVLVGNLGVIRPRRAVLCGLERLLHFLGKAVDAHGNGERV